MSLQTVQQKPWSYISMVIVSLLFGVGAGFLITWQNLKRIGREDRAKTFFISGGLLFLVSSVLVAILPWDLPRILIYGAAIYFPYWFLKNYLDPWQKEHEKKAKFSWDIVGWGFLGLIITLLIVIPIIYFTTSHTTTIRQKDTPVSISPAQKQFNEDEATQFIYARLGERQKNLTDQDIKFILQKEWEYQYDHVQKDTNGQVVLIDRSNPQLVAFLETEAKNNKRSVTKEQIKEILFVLPEYEDSLSQ